MAELEVKKLHNEIIRLDAENQALRYVLLSTIGVLSAKDTGFVLRVVNGLASTPSLEVQSGITSPPSFESAFNTASRTLKDELLHLHDELIPG